MRCNMCYQWTRIQRERVYITIFIFTIFISMICNLVLFTTAKSYLDSECCANNTITLVDPKDSDAIPEISTCSALQNMCETLRDKGFSHDLGSLQKASISVFFLQIVVVTMTCIKFCVYDRVPSNKHGACCFWMLWVIHKTFYVLMILLMVYTFTIPLMETLKSNLMAWNCDSGKDDSSIKIASGFNGLCIFIFCCLLVGTNIQTYFNPGTDYFEQQWMGGSRAKYIHIGNELGNPSSDQTARYPSRPQGNEKNEKNVAFSIDGSDNDEQDDEVTIVSNA